MADEKELSIEEMTAMLEGNSPAEEPPKEEAGAGEPAAAASEDAKQPASPEPEPEKPADQGEKKESASGAGKTQDTQESKEAEKPKGKFAPKEPDVPEAVQKRINKAIYEKHEAERKAEAAAREAEDLRKKLEQKTQAPGKPASDEKPSPTKPAFQFTEKEPVEDDFETLAEFIKASSAYEFRKNAAEAEYQRQVAETERQQAEKQKSWGSKVEAYAETNPKIGEAIKSVGTFLTTAGVADYVMALPEGPDVVMYLHEHPEETLAVAKTGDPTRVAAFVGAIAAKISNQTSTPKPKPDSQLEELPEPVKVVGGKASPTGGVDLSDDKVSMDDWVREAKRQLEAAS